GGAARVHPAGGGVEGQDVGVREAGGREGRHLGDQTGGGVVVPHHLAVPGEVVVGGMVGGPLAPAGREAGGGDAEVAEEGHVVGAASQVAQRAVAGAGRREDRARDLRDQVLQGGRGAGREVRAQGGRVEVQVGHGAPRELVPARLHPLGRA